MRIGLTYTGNEEKHQNYARWIQQGFEDIEVVKLSVEGGDVGDCDALVLSGGVDIHPSFYGGGEEYSSGGNGAAVKWNADRDAYEKKMLEKAWEQGKPVLGVCRGLQMINVVCGGTLVQDLGAGDAVHQHMQADKVHGVEVEEGSQLFGIVGSGGWINSAHHQAIDLLGKGLKVNCRAEDGVIEGVEWAAPAGRPFMLAVQWHPERMYVNGFKDKDFYLAIRDQFIAAVKKTL